MHILFHSERSIIDGGNRVGFCCGAALRSLLLQIVHKNEMKNENENAYNDYW